MKWGRLYEEALFEAIFTHTGVTCQLARTLIKEWTGEYVSIHNHSKLPKLPRVYGNNLCVRSI